MLKFGNKKGCAVGMKGNGCGLSGVMMLAGLLLAASEASAFTWKAKSTAAEKAALVDYLRRSEVTCAVVAPEHFAAELEAQTNTTDWMQCAIDYGTKVLAAREGRDAADSARRFALEVIDYPLHVDNYGPKITSAEMSAFNDMVVRYARGAKDRVLGEVRAARVPEGELWAWRIYNMAFILKGPRHTVALDLTPRPQLIAKPYAELMKDFTAAVRANGGKTPQRLDFHAGAPQVWCPEDWTAFAEVVDVAFLTHPHGDHTSEPFLREMIRLGKPVVLPGDVTTYVEVPGKPQGERVPFTTGPSCIRLLEDHAEPVDVAGIGVRNFRGYQDDVPCNVYVLDIDGVRVVDNGDNYDRGKEKLVSQVPPADLIIASTWNSVHHILGCVQAAPGFDMSRAAFLPAHENELGHSVGHRESYHEMYTTPERLGKPAFPLKRTFPLGWGECFRWSAPNPLRSDGKK